MMPIRIPEAEVLFHEYKSLLKLLKLIEEEKELTVIISRNETLITIEDEFLIRLNVLNHKTIANITNEQLHICEEKIKEL